jgi:8-oxo-dGTP pyrophosphatase MutT (NUDIX family)
MTLPGSELTCTNALREVLAKRLRRFPVIPLQDGECRKAAVAICVTDTAPGSGGPAPPRSESPSNEAALILTRRASSLPSHPGQWALPGGGMDPGEQAEDAALRELHEEVGLSVPRAGIIGRLDDYITRSGYIITPVVLWAGPGVRLRPDPAEVSSAHRIPLSELLRPDAPILESIPESPHPVLLMPVGHSAIAAPTAALIYQFREVALLSRHTRVAHFEQPYFAWR